MKVVKKGKKTSISKTDARRKEQGTSLQNRSETLDRIFGQPLTKTIKPKFKLSHPFIHHVKITKNGTETDLNDSNLVGDIKSIIIRSKFDVSLLLSIRTNQSINL